MGSHNPSHQFPRALYPRYSNTVDYVQPLVTRCRELISQYYPKDKIDCLEPFEFGDVYVETTLPAQFSCDLLTVKRPSKSPSGTSGLPSFTPNRVVTRNGSNTKLEEYSNTASPQNGSVDKNAGKLVTKLSPRVLVTGTTDMASTSTLKYDIVVFVSDFEQKTRQHKRKLYGEDILEDNSKPEDVAETISLLLERYVLKYFRRYVDLVQCLELEGEGTNSSEEVNKERKLTKQNDDARACLLRPEESLGECGWSEKKPKTTKQKENLEVTGESKTAKIVQSHIKKLSSRDFQQEVTELLAECQAVYLRSKVPKEDQPTRKLRTLTDKGISTDLFSNIPEISACGYRFDIFTVFVDEEKESPCLITSIEETLRTKGIFKFAIRKGPRQITEYSNHSVGSEIVVLESEKNITGTLGGFAQSETELFALTANHVTEHLEKVRVRCDLSGDIVDFGTVLKPDSNSPTDPQPVDISAIRVNRDNVNCNTNFKDSTGCMVNSELFKMEQIEMLCGRYVHMWAAGSKPGLGKITMPDLHFRNDPSNPAPNLASKHIVVEDKAANRTGPIQRFATRGDSGAIICADTLDGDAVDVISIFIGERQDSGCATDQDSRCASRDDTKKRYHSFSLEAGFSYLHTKHGRSFELCPFNNSNI